MIALETNDVIIDGDVWYNRQTKSAACKAHAVCGKRYSSAMQARNGSYYLVRPDESIRPTLWERIDSWFE